MFTHTESSPGEKPFRCKECEAGFVRNYQLKQHMLKHTGEKPFSCKECGARFSRSAHLKRHLIRHTGRGAGGVVLVEGTGGHPQPHGHTTVSVKMCLSNKSAPLS